MLRIAYCDCSLGLSHGASWCFFFRQRAAFDTIRLFFGFPRPPDQHIARSIPNYLLRHAADQRAAQEARATRTDADQIGFWAARSVCQGVSRATRRYSRCNNTVAHRIGKRFQIVFLSTAA